MFSAPEVQALARDFVWIKIDPNEEHIDRRPFRYKATGYVPEVIFIDVRGESDAVIARLEDRSVEGVVRTMKKVLSDMKPR